MLHESAFNDSTSAADQCHDAANITLQILIVQSLAVGVADRYTHGRNVNIVGMNKLDLFMISGLNKTLL